jgi:hypothetical protein
MVWGDVVIGEGGGRFFLGGGGECRAGDRGGDVAWVIMSQQSAICHGGGDHGRGGRTKGPMDRRIARTKE